MATMTFYADGMEVEWGDIKFKLNGSDGESIVMDHDGEMIICQQEYRLSPSKGFDRLYGYRNQTEYKQPSIREENIGDTKEFRTSLSPFEGLVDFKLISIEHNVIKTYDKKQIAYFKKLTGSGSCSASMLQDLCLDYCSIYKFELIKKLEN